ncbi:hypothetical protein QYE76_041972 [Lolium multiflorum]|uniref:Nuclease HARBI1 n=1 Tax=Lolium multiflorum TaxID=4521 RepID=A0AAD8WUM9_LOLMU|nr:hypothetical protein QYE76_041972 [Lolium multiflorum]
MSLNLFKHIAAEVTKYDRFFEQRRNAAGELGHSTYQKVTAALRMLAYGIPADLIDDHLSMGESTSILCVKRFVVAIVNVFGSTYLRAPNAQDTARLLEINANRGFPGMLGSIDCMHWSWKNCPAAWHGQFKGYKKDATIVLEAVADQETWIWHAFFGMPGSCNDINVLQRSPLMTRLAMREGPLVEFEANGHKYNYGYFLADGIYPRWQTFVKPIIQPKEFRFGVDKEGSYRLEVPISSELSAIDSDFSSGDEELSSPRFINTKTNENLAKIFSDMSFESSVDSDISSDLDSVDSFNLIDRSSIIGKICIIIIANLAPADNWARTKP